MNQYTLLNKALLLRGLLIDFATGNEAEVESYAPLRSNLLSDRSTRELLPAFVVNCRDLKQFWHFIKSQFDHYAERRTFIYEEFQPLISKLELDQLEKSTPHFDLVATNLENLDSAHINELWTKAIERCVEDPEGAITAARSLLESVCKSILEDLGIGIDEKWDLPKLYNKVAEQLNLGPSQHTEEVFRQILGGCKSVVEGLGGLRNKLGDAHGKGKAPVRPSKRHAELATNLSGSMVAFLIATWKTKRTIEKDSSSD